MKKKKILLYADSYGDKVGIGAAYVDYFSQFGEVILVTPDNDLEWMLEIGDILAVPGGADVDSNRYHERPAFKTSRINPAFEYLDLNLLTPWVATGKPVIGICRGMQTLNVVLGGSLIQDLSGHVGDDSKRASATHEIYTDIPGFKVYDVNSYHHQGVKRLGEGMIMKGWGSLYKGCPSLRFQNELQRAPVYEAVKIKGQKTVYEARKNKQGNTVMYCVVPEIIQHETKPFLGVQWHPEAFFCELTTQLIDEMLVDYYGEDEYNPIELDAMSKPSSNTISSPVTCEI